MEDTVRNVVVLLLITWPSDLEQVTLNSPSFNFPIFKMEKIIIMTLQDCYMGQRVMDVTALYKYG